MQLLPFNYLLKTYSVRLTTGYAGLLAAWMMLPDSLQDWALNLLGRSSFETVALIMMITLLVARAVRQPALEGQAPDEPVITGHGVL
jgi:hypothetical protein